MALTATAPRIVPTDIGLPSKFAAYRQGQEDVIFHVACSDRRFSLVSVPTGGGKSIIYTSVALLRDARTLILTANKGLQEQLMNDFGAIGLIDVRGQNNYKCVAGDDGGYLSEYGHTGITCDEGPCHAHIDCDLKGGGCLWYDDMRRARASKLVVSNYSFWLTLGRFSDPEVLGKFDLLILDEAQRAPEILVDFCGLTLESSEIRNLIDMDDPPIDEGSDAWVEWAEIALRKCREVYVATRDELDALIRESQLVPIARNEVEREAQAVKSGVRVSSKKSLSRRMKRIIKLGRNLKELASSQGKWRRSEPADPSVNIPGMSNDWVTERVKEGTQFMPVWGHAYAEEYLFRDIPKVILTSATLSPIVASYLGIGEDDFDYKDFPSTFAVKNRPIIWVRSGIGLNRDSKSHPGQIKVWVRAIDAIIRDRIDRNGVIHTHSYDWQRLIYEYSQFKGMMLIHTSRTTRSVVDMFQNIKVPRILVSPSVKEGYDFPGDISRYQIIAKIPFIDTRSLITQARIKSDKRYHNYVVSLDMIQMAGRSVRAEDDWAETFIVDDQWGWFRPAAQKMGMWPGWFSAAFKKADKVPPPPPLGHAVTAGPVQHHFRCRNCRTVKSVTIRMSDERCKLCGSGTNYLGKW